MAEFPIPWIPPWRSLKRPMLSLKSRSSFLLIALFPSRRILIFTTSRPLQPRLPPNSTSPTSPCFSVHTRFSSTSLCVRPPPPVSRSDPQCALLCCLSRRFQRGWALPWEPGPVIMGLLPALCREPNWLYLPDQLACSKHIQWCHPCLPAPKFLPISSWLVLHLPLGRGHYILVVFSHREQLHDFTLLACPS